MSITDRPSAGARDRFLQAAARQPASRPRTWHRRVSLACFGATAWLGTALSVLGIRPDWGDLPAPAVTATVVVLLAAALLASAIGLARGRSMVGTTTESLSLAAWGVPDDLGSVGDETPMKSCVPQQRTMLTGRIRGIWHPHRRSFTQPTGNCPCFAQLQVAPLHDEIMLGADD